MRSAVAVPVAGAGESGIAAAARDGRRYSIVTVWPQSLHFLYVERLAHAAGGELCAEVHHVFAEFELKRLGTEHSAVSRMERRDEQIVEHLAENCRRAVASDGSEAVLLAQQHPPEAVLSARRGTVPLVLDACSSTARSRSSR